MKKGNREVNIVNLSMLDVICGALGAVLIIMISLSTRPSEAAPPCPQCPACPPQGESCEPYKKQLSKLELRRPVVFYIWWGADEDIDIYVQDETGKMKPPGPVKQGPVFNGDVATERRGAPGFEIWMNRDMPRGSYKVYAKLLEANPQKRAATWVAGGYMYEQSVSSFGHGAISPERPILHLGTIVMGGDGKIRLERAPGITPPQS